MADKASEDHKAIDSLLNGAAAASASRYKDTDENTDGLFLFAYQACLTYPEEFMRLLGKFVELETARAAAGEPNGE